MNTSSLLSFCLETCSSGCWLCGWHSQLGVMAHRHSSALGSFCFFCVTVLKYPDNSGGWGISKLTVHHYRKPRWLKLTATVTSDSLSRYYIPSRSREFQMHACLCAVLFFSTLYISGYLAQGIVHRQREGLSSSNNVIKTSSSHVPTGQPDLDSPSQ